MNDAVDTHGCRGSTWPEARRWCPSCPRPLQDRSRIPVEIFDPFMRVSVDPRRFHVDYLRANAPVAAIAFGLALRRAGDSA